jgi:hypothetical protein
LVPPHIVSSGDKNGLDPETCSNKKNQKTEVPKSYSILIPHRKGEGAKRNGCLGVGTHPHPSRISPLNSCPKWGKPGVRALKNSHTPFYQNQRGKKKFPFPPKKPKYIYIFLKKTKNSKALSVKVNLE